MQRVEPLARGLWGVLATPFTAGTLEMDKASLRRQVQLHRAAGSTGLVVLGVFGEAARLTPAEQVEVVETVTRESAELPIVIGLSALDTAAAVSTASRLLEASNGARPSFMVQINTNQPDELAAHFAAVHQATGCGVVVQDYPVASKVNISSTELVYAILQCPFAVAVKSEAPPTSLAIAELSQQLDVPVFGGLGGLGLLDELMAGAAGAMTGFSYPEALKATLAAFEHGGYPAAREAYLPWLPLVNFEAQAGIGLAIRKSSLHTRGTFTSEAVRPPAPAMPEVLRPLLRAHLAQVDAHLARILQKGVN